MNAADLLALDATRLPRLRPAPCRAAMHAALARTDALNPRFNANDPDQLLGRANAMRSSRAGSALAGCTASRWRSRT